MGCKSNVVGKEKSALYLSYAKRRARRSWSKKARKKYGWSYRKWSNASPKGYITYADGTDLLLWKARAFGTPCK